MAALQLGVVVGRHMETAAVQRAVQLPAQGFIQTAQKHHVGRAALPVHRQHGLCRGNQRVAARLIKQRAGDVQILVVAGLDAAEAVVAQFVCGNRLGNGCGGGFN